MYRLGMLNGARSALYPVYHFLPRVLWPCCRKEEDRPDRSDVPRTDSKYQQDREASIFPRETTLPSCTAGSGQSTEVLGGSRDYSQSTRKLFSPGESPNKIRTEIPVMQCCTASTDIGPSIPRSRYRSTLIGEADMQDKIRKLLEGAWKTQAKGCRPVKADAKFFRVRGAITYTLLRPEIRRMLPYRGDLKRLSWRCWDLPNQRGRSYLV